ncbi:MAG: agmatine deiminase family protein [Planctomycetes bacterium]|nr:agmatine deiminase family protein [Planctomycetota bacterium]
MGAPRALTPAARRRDARDDRARDEALFPASEGRRAGDEVIYVASASYLNLVIANDLVLVPSFVEDGTPATVQDEVRRTLEDAFPGRTIRFVHAAAFTWDGGSGPHCATLSQPRAPSEAGAPDRPGADVGLQRSERSRVGEAGRQHAHASDRPRPDLGHAARPRVSWPLAPRNGACRAGYRTARSARCPPHPEGCRP